MLGELKQPNFSPLALEILHDRYLHRDSDGNVTETPKEMLIRVAKHVASAEEPTDRVYWTSKFYAMMADLDFLPNSPTLMNAGRPYPHGQLAACFVVGIEDSMESICGALRKQMLIHKTGGGTGFNFSKLRPKGANVNSTNGKASGPVSFMRLFDLSTEVVQQGGCFTGDTLIATAEGPVKISELKEGMLVYSHHPEKGFILTPCTAPFMTRRDTQIMELETDNGLKIRATPDHPFMYRSGFAFREKGFGKLCDLPIGTPLMPLTTYVKKGYRFIALQDGKDSRMPLHRWLAEQGGKSGSVIHHINGNCLDNRLSNLTNEFDKALAYADARNCKVAAKSPCGRADVWNVEIPETHNYVVCNADGTAGVVVSNTRRGANMAILNCDHPDIEEFISCKDNEGKITNFNLSVGITDEFMKRACDDPTSSAAALLRKIAEHAWKSGDPGVVFFDAINRDNLCPQLGRIEATNPCGESPLLANEACNLGSINLAHMVKGRRVNWNKLTDTVETAVRFLDDVIGVSQYPLPEIAEAVKQTRKIGLGVMGWADMLYQLRIPYASTKAVDLANEIMAYIDDIAWDTSHKLGVEKSFCPTPLTYGMSALFRNATVTCIAPTGTLALLADCSSGIEPIFANYHTRKVTLGDGTIVEKEINNPHYMDLLNDEFFTDDEVAEITKTAYQIEWNWHIDHQAAFQQYTDLAVSKTVNLPNSATVDDVIAVYVYAWKMGCKGTTIYRDGSRSSQVLTEAPVRCKECDV